MKKQNAVNLNSTQSLSNHEEKKEYKYSMNCIIHPDGHKDIDISLTNF